MKPSFDELQVAPELAVLAAIDRVADIATAALEAAQPELHYDDVDYLSATAMTAARIVRVLSELRYIVARYHAAVADQLERDRAIDVDGDIPF
jgi:hypothetical protein